MKLSLFGNALRRMKWGSVTVLFLIAALSLHACGRGGHRQGGGVVPPAPTGVAVTAFSGAVTIGWDPVAGATSYRIYMAASPGVTKANYQTLPSGDQNAVAAGPFTHSGLTDGTTYYFVVTALNAAGEGAESAEVSARPISTALPSPPTGLRAISSDGQVTLEWNSVTGASSYFVYRATVSGVSRSNWNTIVGGSRTQVVGGATLFIASGLTNGTTYYFVVTAQNSLGQSVDSAEVSATPFAADTVPTQPKNLTASAGDTKVVLNWSASAGAASYTLYWSNSPGVTTKTGTAITDLSGTAYTHTGLVNNTPYYYILTAVNSIGESLPSSETSATPIPTPPPAAVTLPPKPEEVTIAGTATLRGEVNPLGFSGDTTVYFEWGVTTGYGSVTPSQTKPGGNIFAPVSDSIINLQRNTPYHYRIVATNVNGTSYGADQTFVLPFLGGPNEFPVRDGGSPNDVVVADFDGPDSNNKSWMDLAVVNSATSDVSVLPGKGDGTFGTATNYPVAPNGVQSHPEHLAVGDFNNDGKPDLIASNQATGTISLLLNNGTGFDPFTSFDLWVDPADAGKTFAADLVVADFNGDGNQDVAVAAVMNGVGNVVILLGDGSGGFGSKTLFPAGTSPSGIVAGDFNGDAHLDLVVANRLVNAVSLLRGDGSGSFDVPPTSFSVGSDAIHGPVAVAAGDFNADAHLDLAVANRDSGTISIFLNDGNGGFATPTRFAVGLEPQAVETGDFNGGGLDLIVPNFRTADDSQSVTIYLGVGDGTFGPSVEFPLGTGKNPVAAATGDFNKDNKLDLVVVNKSANSVSVLLGQ